MKWLGAGNVPVSSTNNTVLNNSGSHLQVSSLLILNLITAISIKKLFA